MGAHPYHYFVPYQADLKIVLAQLREREFNAGRYNPAMPFLTFPIEEGSPAPGPQHDSIEDAQADAAEDGTRSILDIDSIGGWPEIGVAAPLPDKRLQALFETTQPDRAMLEDDLAVFEDIERGHCVYIIVYKNGAPHEIMFAGYSYD